MKVLNLYAGVGGNRQEWGDECQVTAVEYDSAIAAVYQERFPEDTVIVGDAHAYLREHFGEYGFIWSSPPCQSHGQYRHNVGVRAKGYAPLFPDMALYEEILFLRHHAEMPWVVENVVPYYEPLVPPTKRLGRHLFWANFDIPDLDVAAKGIRTRNKIADYDHLGVDLRGTAIKDKRQVLRNMVDSALGAHIFAAGMNVATL